MFPYENLSFNWSNSGKNHLNEETVHLLLALCRSPAIPATVLVGAAPRVGNRARPRRRRPYPREHLEGSCPVPFLPSPSSGQRAEASRPRRRRSSGRARRPDRFPRTQSCATSSFTSYEPPRARWSSTTAESGTPAAAAIDVHRRASTSTPSTLFRPSSASNWTTVSSPTTSPRSPACSPPDFAAAAVDSKPRRRGTRRRLCAHAAGLPCAPPLAPTARP